MTTSRPVSAGRRPTTLDKRIAEQARRVTDANNRLYAALKLVREARAARDTALTRLEHLIEQDET